MDADPRFARQGEVYRVLEEFEGEVVIHYSAPYTGGYDRIFPVGLEFVVNYSDPEGTYFEATPKPYVKWESYLAGSARANQNFSHCSIAVEAEHLERRCTRIDEKPQTP